jgi:hypothetical protein
MEGGGCRNDSHNDEHNINRRSARFHAECEGKDSHACAAYKAQSNTTDSDADVDR